MRTTSSREGGVGLLGVLTIVFIVLKLTHNINWSWWWVLSPMWISLGLFIFVFLLAFSFFAIRGSRR